MKDTTYYKAVTLTYRVRFLRILKKLRDQPTWRSSLVVQRTTG